MKKPFLTQYGYDLAYYPTVMSGPVFRWTRGDIEVNSSRDGVGMDVRGMVRDVPALKSVLESAAYVSGKLKQNDRPDGLMFDGKFYSKESWLRPE